MDTGPASRSPSSSGSLDPHKEPVSSSKPDLPPVKRVTPQGAGHQHSKKLPERRAAASKARPAVNAREVSGHDLLQDYQSACATMENLLGQQYLNEHYELLSQYLQSPDTIDSDDLPFDIVYIDENRQIHTMDSFESQHFDQLRDLIKPLEPTEERSEMLEVRMSQTMGQIQYDEERLEELGVEVNPVTFDVGSIALDPLRIDVCIKIPGYSPASVIDSESSQGIAEEIEEGFVYKPEPDESMESTARTEAVIPTHPLSKAKTPSDEWLDFYRKGNSAITGQTWTRDAVMALDTDRLETEHQYIQLLFPNRAPSPMNTAAPVLTDEMVAEIQDDKELQRLIMQSLDKILDFWGCTRSGDSIEVTAGKKPAHKKWAANDNDHNHQRITRVLNFLMECGYESAACSMERCLQQQRKDNGVPANTYWSEAVEKRRNAPRLYFSNTPEERVKAVRHYNDYARSHPYGDFTSAKERQDFYDRDAPCYEFTNFWSGDNQNLNLLIDGKRWRTTEHYFQAMKYQDEERQEQVRRKVFPREAFDFTRAQGNQARADWEKVKEGFMLHALREKAMQNRQFRQTLEDTGNKVLVESSHQDGYWGYGKDKNGLNRLGYMLMQVRDEIRAGLL